MEWFLYSTPVVSMKTFLFTFLPMATGSQAVQPQKCAKVAGRLHWPRFNWVPVSGRYGYRYRCEHRAKAS